MPIQHSITMGLIRSDGNVDPKRWHCEPPAAERGGNSLNGVKDFRTENGSSQGLNLAVTGLFAQCSLDKGRSTQILLALITHLHFPARALCRASHPYSRPGMLRLTAGRSHHSHPTAAATLTRHPARSFSNRRILGPPPSWREREFNFTCHMSNY